ncbi:MAG TPA: hypothetical protein VHM69_04210, partial [Rubrobacter sp.]|nr:hypothetical protein [Rubrobacter sp.]
MGGKRMRPMMRVVAMIVVLAGLSVIGACGADTATKKDQSSRDAAAGSKTAEGESGSKSIPQPVMLEDLATAPEGARVDISMPVFSNPTEITNPLFPVSKQESVLMVGRVDDKPFRTEV